MLVSIHTAWIISRTRWTMPERYWTILLLRAMSLFKVDNCKTLNFNLNLILQNLFLKSETSSTPDWRTSQVLLTIFWSRWIRSLRPTGLTSRSSSALWYLFFLFVRETFLLDGSSESCHPRRGWGESSLTCRRSSRVTDGKTWLSIFHCLSTILKASTCIWENWKQTRWAGEDVSIIIISSTNHY